MRKLVTISMPDEMYEHLRRNVSRVRYGSVSEYIRELIRKDQPSTDEPQPGDNTTGGPKRLEDDDYFANLFDVRSANEWMDEYRRSKEADRTSP